MSVPDVSPPASTAGWVDELAEALGDDHRAAEEFARRAPAGYPQQVPPAQAALDVANLAALEGARVGTLGRQRLVVSDVPTAAAGAGAETAGTTAAGAETAGALAAGATTAGAGAKTPGLLRLRRYATAAVELSAFLPVLESFGLVVVEAVPMAIAAGAGGQPAAHIDDFGLRRAAPAPFVADVDGARLVAAIEALAAGATELDSLNRLVLAAGLDWAQVRLLRAYRRYRRQAGSPHTDEQLDDPLVAFPDVARLLVRLVEARFDPAAEDDTARAGAAESVRVALVEHLAEVDRLEEDQVLRGYLALVDATVRTSYFLRGDGGSVLPTVAVKFDSRAVPDLPRPRPEIEAFVHGPAVEGIHLRFGHVARGGIRWSERAEDFRTEILGLAAAQLKKNVVIVPTGAKGGFVCRGPAAPDFAQVRSAYEVFVSSLLDLADNIVDGVVVTPAGVVGRDGEDPYLVVAADKGTATFSDVANALAEARGFWLGDAFASGGSHGYDHKAMGITARGAWVAVRSHFHQLGVDVQTETIRVSGVGDMSGDVFGNGMLLSRTLALVAAFDHRHVFIDPDPDPEVAYAERARLAALSRSSWDDYDRTAISAGGGVWSREAKSIPLSPAARRALGVTAEELSPPEVISAVLAAPVDLLWFAGIGTYLKAPGESDADVGDHDNDQVRITADQVRARVIAEGGNLAVTQRGRIRYSRRGGRINTDFIDNVAGVATSDREVNLKILIDLAIRSGRLERSQRDELLAASEGHVATEVLRLVDHSVAALNRAVPASAGALDAYEAYMADLESTGLMDRAVEDLPDDEEIARRRAAGAGLIRPELAVLLAFAVSDLSGAVERSSLPEDPVLLDAVRPYFPPEIVERFDDLIPRHRLYPQLVATALAGEVVEQMGPVWAHETAAELGVALADLAGAYWSARQVLDAGSVLGRLERAGTSISADAEAALHHEMVGAVNRLVRRYVVTGRTSPSEILGAAGAVAEEQRGGPPSASGVAAADTPSFEELRAAVEARAGRVDLADAGPIASRTGWSVDSVLAALGALDEAAGVDRLASALDRLEPSGRWAEWQVRSLGDDVAAWRAHAVETALREAGPSGTPRRDALAGAVAINDWVAARGSPFARLRDLLDQLERLRGRQGAVAERRAGPDEVALAGVVVRRLPR